MDGDGGDAQVFAALAALSATFIGFVTFAIKRAMTAPPVPPSKNVMSGGEVDTFRLAREVEAMAGDVAKVMSAIVRMEADRNAGKRIDDERNAQLLRAMEGLADNMNRLQQNQRLINAAHPEGRAANLDH